MTDNNFLWDVAIKIFAVKIFNYTGSNIEYEKLHQKIKDSDQEVYDVVIELFKERGVDITKYCDYIHNILLQLCNLSKNWEKISFDSYLLEEATSFLYPNVIDIANNNYGSSGSPERNVWLPITEDRYNNAWNDLNNYEEYEFDVPDCPWDIEIPDKPNLPRDKESFLYPKQFGNNVKTGDAIYLAFKKEPQEKRFYLKLMTIKEYHQEFDSRYQR